jgi:monoamine oxidase
MPIELGAEFVHGRAPELQEVIAAASLTMVDIGGTRWTPSSTTLRPADDFWKQLERVMQWLERDVRRGDRSFADFIARQPGGPRLRTERRLVREYVEGFHAADPRLVSARSLSENGHPGDDRRERRLGRVVDGYDRVPASLAAPILHRIHLSRVVTLIEWEPGHVSVHAKRPSGRSLETVTARAAIVAVPLGVLKANPDQEGAIRFDPSLDQKHAALQRLASGSAVRIVCRFRERFWAADWFAKLHRSEDLDTWSFLHGHDRQFPTWWTAYPATEPLLVGWCGGPRASEASRLVAPEIVDRAVDSLAAQIGVTRRRLASMIERTWMHDWEHDPFARGAYSYQMVGGADSPAALAKPMGGTLFFAGEATETSGDTGTVHGAIATGRRAARQVIHHIV